MIQNLKSNNDAPNKYPEVTNREVIELLGFRFPESLTESIIYGFSATPIDNHILISNNKVELNTIFIKVKNSIILTEFDLENNLSVSDNNSLIITLDNFWLNFKKLVDTFSFKVMKNLITFDNYSSIMKKSKVISKTAKIFNSAIGNECCFHHNVLVGCDDLQVINEPELMSIPQLGGVMLGNKVEVFNNSVIYRGCLGLTYIGDNVKIGTNSVIESDCYIESNVYIGNNCVIGRNSQIPEGIAIPSGTVIKPDTVINQSN